VKDRNIELGQLNTQLSQRTTQLQSSLAERAKAEAGLRQSREQYRTILQTTVDGFWITDTEGRFLDVNDAYGHLTGYSHEELLSMRIHDVEALETQDETPQHIRRIIERRGIALKLVTGAKREELSMSKSASTMAILKEAGSSVSFETSRGASGRRSASTS